ncbi:hypothetical protein MSAN_01027600 [Mycena sanguinolenta]|uniref:F-box domain-containing protein n=1 Tax=Mycena sanguinolenta TaxID=230812 RepID=A0A8H7D644_9AGAR|nr:hypothetical protein MSAN_01027600 [Mycena sanguinolenta]
MSLPPKAGEFKPTDSLSLDLFEENRVQALISPWRQLPVEIISKIFIFTLACRGNIHQDDPWDDDRAGTLLLCKICSEWRAIALRTPALWNTLSISALGLARPPEWISTWLARSRSSPVFLQLLWDSETLRDAINSVMSIFASHLHHTAELEINGIYFLDERLMENHAELTFNLSGESLNAPLLSSVYVCLPEGSVWDWIHAACRASPCLTHLTTSHPSLDLFPLANLTEFTWIHEAPMSQVFKIFESAPNLRYLDINVAGPVVPSSARSRLTMQSITKLEIASYEHLGEFLEQTEFPSLVNLGICFVNTWLGPPFLSFLSRSSCALTALAFHECVISSAEVISCLQHSACKMLESFSLDECSPEDVDILLQYLTYQGPEHFPSCSNLRTIYLYGISSTDGLLSTMVSSRCSSTLSSGPPEPARLTEIWFSFADVLTQKTDHPDDWKRLQEIEMMKKLKLKIGWPVIDDTA